MRRILAAVALAAAIIVLIVFATYAFAGDGGSPVSVFLVSLKPFVAEIVGLAIAAALAWLVKRFRDWTGMEIEARHREALQSALENAARLAIDKAVPGDAASVSKAILTHGVGYVERSVPDAVRHFDLSPDRIGELLRPKLAGRAPS